MHYYNTLFQDRNLKNFLGRNPSPPPRSSRFRRSVLCVSYFQCRLLATLTVTNVVQGKRSQWWKFTGPPKSKILATPMTPTRGSCPSRATNPRSYRRWLSRRRNRLDNAFTGTFRTPKLFFAFTQFVYHVHTTAAVADFASRLTHDFSLFKNVVAYSTREICMHTKTQYER